MYLNTILILVVFSYFVISPKSSGQRLFMEFYTYPLRLNEFRIYLICSYNVPRPHFNPDL